MAPDSPHLPGRESLLEDGLGPGRRASLLLFAIEARTAWLAAKSREATAAYLTAEAVAEREQAFLQAIAQGRGLPQAPTIQDLERHASAWAPLAAGVDARLRAGVAHALGSKHTFTRAAVQGVRANLGLDGADVQAAYRRLYGEPLDSIYAPRLGIGARFRWAVAHAAEALEALPPFWVAFILTLPLGGGQLALPIAVAGIGALPGIVAAVVFGLVNALTVAALAEAVARSGTTRYGTGFLGQLAGEYLGRSASALYTVISLLDLTLFLLVFYLGIAGTFADVTPIRAEIWLAVVFGICLFFLSRRSLNSTVASSVVLTATNLVLFTAIPLLVLPKVRLEYLSYSHVPCTGGRACDLTLLQQVFGIMLASFYSHGIVANYGRAILRRDPGGRSWVLGCVCAIGATTVVSCLWIVAVNGAVEPGALAAETGTAISAVAGLVGSAVSWLGTLAVVLSMGLGCIHLSLGLLFTVSQWLPRDTGGAGRLANRALAMSPAVLVFIAAELIMITGAGSFSGLLSVFGAIAMPVLSGMFPVLLLAATRRKGDFVVRPGRALRLLGNGVVLGLLCVFFVGIVLVYGIFVWQGLVERVAALAVGGSLVATIAAVLGRGALEKRVVIQLREDRSPGGRSGFNVMAGGEPLVATSHLSWDHGDQVIESDSGQVRDFGSLRSLALDLPATGAELLKVWVHRVTPAWGSEGLGARVVVGRGEGAAALETRPVSGQIEVPFDGAPSHVEIAPSRSRPDAGSLSLNRRY